MIKYATHAITFEEVPDEICLTITITNCRGSCPGCHSPYLRDDVGKELTEEHFKTMLAKYGDIATCVCLMGEGNDSCALAKIAKIANTHGLKVCLYSGRDVSLQEILDEYEPACKLDYVKIGSYREDLGGLTSKRTNQQMYKRLDEDDERIAWENITARFWYSKVIE